MYQVIQFGNGCAGNAIVPIDFLGRGQFTLAAFLPVERDGNSGWLGACSRDDVN
jgi:hypothetical protein